MSHNIHLGLEYGGRFLEQLYPGVNWVWFLSKNMHGLTEGYPTIRFDNSSVAVAYDLEDLKAFAFAYGAGKFSKENISGYADAYLNQLELEDMASRLGHSFDRHSYLSSDFMSAEATNDKDYFQLSSGEFFAMTERLEEILSIQEETAQALVTLATTVRAFKTPGTATSSEIDALCGIATTHARHAYDACDLLADLNQALADRCKHELKQLIQQLEK